MGLFDIHVGDHLIIREWDDLVSEFGVEYSEYWDDDEDGEPNYIPSGIAFVKPMKDFCGAEVVVTNISCECVYIRDAYTGENYSEHYNFSTDMFCLPENYKHNDFSVSMDEFLTALLCGSISASDSGGEVF